jgi:NADPH:quinone reductase-like Zn-dependent oxidoreductase
MKAYIISDNKNWKLQNLPEPTPKPGEVLINVRANSINFRDWLIVSGKYLTTGKQDCIPLSDGAGEIAAIGEGVTEFKVGDRVMANFFETWESGTILPQYHDHALGGAVDGMLAEKVIRKASGVVKIPEHLSFEEAATLPCAGLTAWNALMESNNPLKPGSTVLTLGTGGVSLFAIQFAKAAGLKVISTSSSDDKLKRLQQLGMTHGINYQTYPEWQNEVKKLTNDLGVDHVIEVGGDTMSRSLDSLKLAGTISTIGFRAGTHELFNPMSILIKSARIQGIYVGSVAMFKAMNRAIETHHIKPIIDEVFDFDNANKALEKFVTGKHFGKVVIRM